MAAHQAQEMTPIRRVPIVQQVEASIRQLIETGAYPPGAKLPTEMELCQHLDVGRGTIREAFRLLQAKGYVELRPGKGAFAAQISDTPPPDLIDWLVRNERDMRGGAELRTALEPMSARLTAQRCSKDDFLRLEQIHRTFLMAMEAQDSVRITSLDDQFHAAIVALCQNDLLIHIYEHICKGMQAFDLKGVPAPQTVQNAVVPHTRILDALRSRDGARAEREMRVHLDKVQEDLIRSISSGL